MTDIRPTDAGRLAELDANAWNALERIGRGLRSADSGLQATLDAVLCSAMSVLSQSIAASLSLLERGRLTPQAVLGEAPRSLAVEQQRSGEGPCVQASREQVVVHIDDTRTDARWPVFGALAADAGIGSMLCLPIWIDDRRLGSLSLFAADTGAYRDEDSGIAVLLATHAAVAIADARRTDNLRRALANRDIIGQAKGILMERHRLTSDQAFERLAATSQQFNRKLAEIAETLATTGELPQR